MTAALAGFAALYLMAMHPPAGHAVSVRLKNLAELGLPFTIGTAFYVWRAYIPLNWFLGLALATMTVAASSQVFFHELLVITLCYWVFLIGYLPGGAIRAYNRLGDYSYGIYIYAFPMQQLIAHFMAPMAPSQNMMLSAPATLVLAIMSWHFIEKPALRAKSYFSQFLSAESLSSSHNR